jgi:Ni,Fe-hydrogenase III small subunit
MLRGRHERADEYRAGVGEARLPRRTPRSRRRVAGVDRLISMIVEINACACRPELIISTGIE